MASPSEKLAQSLLALKQIQEQGIVAIQSSMLTRTHRERLLKHGFIQEVMKGWYIPSGPNELPGETSSWYAAFWPFVAQYLSSRFLDDWCLSPEQSISLHTEDWTVPKQLLLRSPKGGNKPITLLHDTSILDIRLTLFDSEPCVEKNNIRILSLANALVHCSPRYYVSNPNEICAALATFTDGSDILRLLLKGHHSLIAGRLAGAFRHIGKDEIADHILNTMRSVDYIVNETNPFNGQAVFNYSSDTTLPAVNRLRMNWLTMREQVIQSFSPPTKSLLNTENYLNQLNDIYSTDAYHSLSIEGYNVSEDLIKRVQTGEWSPVSNKKDYHEHNAMAARGYWQAFQSVITGLTKVLENKEANSGHIIKEDHSQWYVELFSPLVSAGILDPGDLVGYRNQPVYIRQSKHVPPNSETVRQLMPVYFELLSNETEASVRAVLGHFFFVYIHPYIDGNGRIARFIMNVMFASGGYPWTVIPVKRRTEYMEALEEASIHQNIIPFCEFLEQIIEKD